MSSQSTGPRTDAGKQRSSLNAIKHGLRSQRPVLPDEDPAEWDAFLRDVVQTLEPANTIERELADRVALQMWRQRRAARYELEVVSDEYEEALTGAAESFAGLDPEDSNLQVLAEAQREISKRKDSQSDARGAVDLMYVLPKLPERAPVHETPAWLLMLLLGCRDEPPKTAGELRRVLAAAAKLPEAQALALADEAAAARLKETDEQVAAAKGRFEQLGLRMARRATARSHDQKLLQKQALDRVIRYEAHVGRQLKEALKMLREFQAERRAREAETRHAEAATVRLVKNEEAATAAVPEAIVRRSQLPPGTPAGTGSFGNSESAAPLACPPRESVASSDSTVSEAADMGSPFVRHFSTAPHNGRAGNGKPREKA